MKGVFIKYCQFPINCINCPCMYGGICFVRPPEVDGLIADNVEELYKKGGKPDWCPIVEAEIEPVRHEFWIHDGEDRRCSGCKAIIEKYEWHNHNWNFCYHCGAIMDGGDTP